MVECAGMREKQEKKRWKRKVRNNRGRRVKEDGGKKLRKERRVGEEGAETTKSRESKGKREGK